MTRWLDLPEMLAWQDPDHIEEIRRARDTHVRTTNAAALRHGELIGLPDEAVRVILEAPRTQTCLALCPEEHHRSYLAAATAAERARRDEPWTLPASTRCSTCTLLTSHHDGTTRLWSSGADASWDVRTHAATSQPRLAPGLVLDVGGPAVTGVLPDIPGAAAPLQPQEVTAVHHRADGALRLLAEGAPVAARLVTALTRSVVCRKDRGGPGSCGASSALAIGQTVVRNPQAPAVDEAWFGETLVHEAVHATLDVMRATHPMLLAPERVAQARVASPWTGRLLDVDTYLQACWVWYALTWMWGMVAATAPDRGDTTARVRARGHRAAAGFWSGDVRDGLGEFASLVDPEVLQALGAAQRRLRDVA